VDRSLDENNFMIQGKIFFSYNSSSNNKPIWKKKKKTEKKYSQLQDLSCQQSHYNLT